MYTRITGSGGRIMGPPRDRQNDPSIGADLIAAAAEVVREGGLVLTPDQTDLLHQLAKIAAGLALSDVTHQIDHMLALSDSYARMDGATYPETAITYGADPESSKR